jgi:SAM-dependent methyltransferase
MSTDARNASGRPLAGDRWLEAHHRAKLHERRAFCDRLAALRPTSVLDLGCATGLWLQELHRVLPSECAFIGVDSDTDALAEAQERAAGWSRAARFEAIDLDDPDRQLPQCDLALMFNLSSYLAEPDRLLTRLARRGSAVAVRQYDGAALRFGPMPDDDRELIQTSLRASLGASTQFSHFDLDRMFEALHRAPFRNREIGFETFARTSPFPPDFLDYYNNTLGWTLGYLSDVARERLGAWRDIRLVDPANPSYFYEVDLTAVLS